MRRPTRPVLILVAVALCGCISRKEHGRIVAEASLDCSRDSDCVIAGTDASGCTCPWIVNRRDKAKVDKASRRVFCGGVSADCALLGTPVCREGLCTSSELLP